MYVCVSRLSDKVKRTEKQRVKVNVKLPFAKTVKANWVTTASRTEIEFKI